MVSGFVILALQNTAEMIEMPYLEFYSKERDDFKESFERKLDYKEARIIYQKLKRHYNLYGHLEFTDRIGAGKCGYGSGKIQLRWQTNFGVLCHELAHLYEYKKYNEHRHGKRLHRIIKTMTNYCKKKNYWKEELEQKTEIKIKPEPTKEEIKKKKLDKRKADLERYKKKLNYYTKLYTNKIKKANRGISMLERIMVQSITTEWE